MRLFYRPGMRRVRGGGSDHVYSLIATIRCLAEQLELLYEGLHVDECIIVRFQHEANIVVGHRVLHHKVGFVEYALIIRLLLHRIHRDKSGLVAPYVKQHSFIHV
jgi:hypothetical protein